MSNYEVFSTTADVGIRFQGEGLHAFFNNAIKGLNLLYFDNDPLPAAQPPESRHAFQFHGDSIENVLVNVLAEAVFLLQTREQVTTGIHLLDAGDTFVDARFLVRPLHREPELEIKSVTYHNLEVKRNGSTLATEVIFDI